MPTIAPDDAALVARVIATDDRHAFAELVRRHQGRLRAMLRRMCREDAALADDLAQETFIQAWRKLPQYRADAAFGTWLHRIAHNLFLMQLRSRRDHLPLETPGADLAGGEPSPEAAAVAGGDVRRALARLGDDERAAIVQCYYLERSHEEAARVLGMPVGTVKSHVFRARLKLRDWLGAWAPAGGGEA